jgi:hypothetical protein
MRFVVGSVFITPSIRLVTIGAAIAELQRKHDARLLTAWFVGSSAENKGEPRMKQKKPAAGRRPMFDKSEKLTVTMRLPMGTTDMIPEPRVPWIRRLILRELGIKVK